MEVMVAKVVLEPEELDQATAIIGGEELVILRHWKA
jgi:hypothetical protein